MAWVFLGIAGLMEVFWATCLKLSEGFTKLFGLPITVQALMDERRAAAVKAKLRPFVAGHENTAAGHGLRHLDRHRGIGCCGCGTGVV